MLKINELHTGYDKKPVLFGISLEVAKGEIVSLIGPNGAGKSTVLKAVCGLIPTWQGEMFFSGTKISDQIPTEIIRRGVVYCPQGNLVFGELTVKDNLEIGGFQLSPEQLKERIQETYVMFPILERRQKQIAGLLSGGEQQILALARALMLKPKLLLLDEPSLGLSPGLVDNIFKELVRINSETGTTMLIVEQKVRQVLKICSRVYSLRLGQVAYDGESSDLANNKDKLKELFL